MLPRLADAADPDFADLVGHHWAGPPGRPIVCVHALGGSQAHWTSVGPRLAALGPVFAIDLPGFGRNPRGPGPATLEAGQRQLADTLRSVGPSVVIGSSFGGGVAMLQAASEPATVRGLVLTGSMLPDGHGTPSQVRMHVVRRRLRQRGHDAMAALRALRNGDLRPNHASVHSYLLRGNAANPATVDDAVVAASVRASSGRPLVSTWKTTLEAGRSSFALMTAPARFKSVISAITCPVLVIHGALDRTVPVSAAHLVGLARPDWTVEVLDGVGHLPHLEATNRWLDLVTAWITTV
ncbi:MAG: alpha/beta fold hydrolase [Candidatus Limnocylindrales bacterium]